ncbi:DUF3951 domain-containing protein [Brevibacterium sp. JNUCC-42]|nr:DUF3951 domain-containing protein [Brevibacterium sp. JNUCC-42]
MSRRMAIGVVMYKRIVKKQNVGTYYTPFDKITGQTNVEFHEEKQEKKEQEDEKGDDKDKNEASHDKK